MSYPTITSTTVNSPTTPISKPLVLNEGQMFHGQIKQLFPGQMAEVQIGNQKLYAKLEVPMKAGDSYYFQVNAVKPELQLKIVSGPLGASESQARQLSGLMDAMQLPKTAEMRDLLSFVMKNKIPMTREGLLQAELLLKSVPPSARPEALASIAKIIELKLPLTETVFRSLFGVESKEGLHTVLNTLRSALAGDPTISSQAREAILVALGKMEKPFAGATGGALLGQSLLTLLNQSESPDSRFIAVQMLKSANLLPEQTSLANVQQILTTLLTGGATTTEQSNIQSMLKEISTAPQASLHTLLTQLKAILTSDTSLSTANKEVLTSLIDRALNAQPSATNTVQFVRDFGQALMRTAAENIIASPFASVSAAGGAQEQLLRLIGQQNQPEVLEKLSMLVRNAEQSNHPAIQKQIQLAEAAVASAVDGKAVKDAIQMVVRSFGLNYEAGILSRDANIAQLMETLKPQLLALMQDHTVSQSIRESAEMVVTRMNGPLLASGETGVQHQLVMQVPLDFLGKRIDATLQWNGRMKEDGKIDSDFARILFYLDLHSLDKTIIDMQVQNRVVTVTIYNADKNLRAIGIPIQQSLKTGLESTGYRLSGVFFKEFHEEKAIEEPKKQVYASEQGVDFRI